jgi:peptidoglycan pentaglycine glycine transferase (the first glycine)
MEATSSAHWDEFLSQFPNPHILQTSAWGKLKADFGWQVTHIISGTCGAQVLIRQIFPGINFAYIPKGPVGQGWEQLWPAIDAACKARHCIFLKLEPDLWEGNLEGQDNVSRPKAFVHSIHSVQPQRTILIDLTADEALILGRMKQKTRYNINLALKKNVIVRAHVDLTAFYGLMKITGERDRFGIHSLDYYQKAYDLFHAQDQCQVLAAEFKGEAIAALIIFRAGKRAWYFYGASSDEHREKMPNYLLQWEGMRWAKAQGCNEYDLWGVPDEDLETLEENFSSRSDGLWGVYRFKRGFGGELKRSAGPWDRIYNPFLYRLYTLWLKYRKVEA